MEPTNPPKARRSGLRQILAGIVLLLVLAGFAMLWYSRPKASALNPKITGPLPNRVAFSPDKGNKHVAAVFSDGRLRLWEAASRKEMPVKLPSRWPLNDAAWTGDGTVLFSGGFEQHVLLWDVKSAKARTLPKFATEIVSIAVKPRTPELLVSLTNGDLLRFSLTGGESEKITSGHRGTVKLVRYQPDGKQFVTAGADHKLMWHDSSTSKVTRTIEAHQHEISSLAFAANGQQLASASWDNTVKIWKAGVAEPVATFNHPDGVANVDWLKDQVVTSCWDGQLRVWNLTDGQASKQRACQCETLQFAVWPGKDLIAEVDDGGTLHLDPP